MMCQRPDCAYVHPTFAKYMYQNQMKKKGKDGPYGAPHAGHHGNFHKPNHAYKKAKEGGDAAE